VRWGNPGGGWNAAASGGGGGLRAKFLDQQICRLLGVARRAIDVYDRYSDLLFSFANADLSVGLRGFIIRDFIIRFSIPLDRPADGHARCLEPCSIGLTPPLQSEELRKAKDLNFIYLTESRNLIPGLLALLQALIQLPGINSCLSYLASHCSRRRGSSE
jgi:hypothetical protein